MNMLRIGCVAGVLLCTGVLTTAQTASERARLEERLDSLRAEQARVEQRLSEMNPGGAERPAEELLRSAPPELRERFERMREADPERARRLLQRHRERLGELGDLRERDPEAHRRRVETMQAMRRVGELAREVAQLEEQGKLVEAERVRATMRTEAGFVFDTMLERQRQEIAKHEERIAEATRRLAEARERLADAEANRDERLSERLEQAIERARDRLGHQR